ncbi:MULTISPECIES: Arc family DNA-binding protein [Neobacillus]|uniref:Arc family DNA-binding protein n=1 Tax=Neobacillus rhizophilus TaxID=2833579 RepID=A0A942U833_9BACI|nr:MULTISPECIES: Arc family DNA-binding protein [Neobacillus]MBS4216426.1 Arc family DNA-binding protein [Neobacillus rhizophilus]
MADKKRFLLRVDQKIYDALEKWADDEFRSVNAQIELIIKKALKDAGRLKNSKAPGEKEED